MNKWEKILIIIAGVTLILLGLAAATFISALFASDQMPGRPWRILLFLSSPMWIFSGIRIFSFKKSAQKLAVISYGIALGHAVYYNIFGYLLALYLSYSGENPNPYSITNIQAYFWGTNLWIIPAIIFMIIVFFIGILFLFKNQFK